MIVWEKQLGIGQCLKLVHRHVIKILERKANGDRQYVCRNYQHKIRHTISWVKTSTDF